MSTRGGQFFWVDNAWNLMNEKANMFDYLPGGRYFYQTDLGKSWVGNYIKSHLINHLDNILWLRFPIMPHGSMPGQPYFGPGIPLENVESNKPVLIL
ncbi:hypothetical protein SAMN04488104_10532 [Algoriphagus faecimaris]|uniref:Uncharacterized protein n=1 Tax=Algoriphagus faecimaris TaxID=686796 RepID=A0A1G6XB51_9BACT|nr:hypothetical protein [Algoriphagus faecimaris]SDD74466.1 hypothetical protein SAMN04488104_10532 [Algoriphagus faecimaris]